MQNTMIPTKTRLEPTKIAPETFLIHDHTGEGQAPVLVPLNTMVIRGSEPVVVDTGVAENRELFPGATIRMFPKVTHNALAHHREVYRSITEWW